MKILRVTSILPVCGVQTPVRGMWLMSTKSIEGWFGEVENEVEESEVGWKDGDEEYLWNGDGDSDSDNVGAIKEGDCGDCCWSEGMTTGIIGI